MSKGFIKISRDILKWEWIQDDSMFRVWMYILLKANWKDGKFKGMVIPRGSFVTSYRKMAEFLKLSPNTVRRCINNLRSTGEIDTQSDTRFTIIKVLKYAEYQDFDSENHTRSDTRADTRSDTRADTRSDTRADTDRRNKEIKKLRSKEISLSADGSETEILDPTDLWFEQFWNVYPRKVSKASAKKSFAKVCKNEKTFNQIMEGLRYQVDAVFSNREERYIPHPTTWLNQQRWEDRPQDERKLTYQDKMQQMFEQEVRKHEQGGNDGDSYFDPFDISNYR